MAVLVIVGLARSGKDTAADYIAKKYKYDKYTFSSVLSDILRRGGKSPTKSRMIEVGDKLRNEMGMDAVARLLDRKIRQSGNILLVGPRSIQEIEYFRKKFPNLITVRISAAAEQRYMRKSKIDPAWKKVFFERDRRDALTKGLQKVLDSAQISIGNYSTKKKLYAEIDRMMKTVHADGAHESQRTEA